MYQLNMSLEVSSILVIVAQECGVLVWWLRLFLGRETFMLIWLHGRVSPFLSLTPTARFLPMIQIETWFWVCVSSPQVGTAALEDTQQEFSVMSQITNLGFVGHIWSLSHALCFVSFVLFCFVLQPFKNVQPRLSSWAIQEQARGQIWPAGSNLLMLAREVSPQLYLRAQYLSLLPYSWLLLLNINRGCYGELTFTTEVCPPSQPETLLSWQ